METNLPVSKINSQITKRYLNNQAENQYFERKAIGEKDTKPSKIAQELIGMLNADGGILALGVSDSGEIQNLNIISDELTRYRSLMFDFIAPACSIELEEVTINGNLIFLYHVEQDLERIFCLRDNEKVFLRVQDTNRELNREQIKKLEYDKVIRHFEEEIVKDFDFEDLDISLLNEYKEKINFDGDYLELLYKRHLAVRNEKTYSLKKSAVLLFSKDPEKYIPSASVRYIRYNGTKALVGKNHNVIKDERFENNIPNLIDIIKKFLQVSFKDYYFLDMELGKFKIVPEFPMDAWLEGIVNALCHRSYNIQGNSIYIKHFDNRLEISNSGPLPAQVTVENIRNERYARNPRIARVLEDLGYVRQLNEGVRRIYEIMEKSMLSEPIYEERNDNVYLTLVNKISSHSKTINEKIIQKIESNWVSYNDTQRKILSFLFFQTEGTIAQIVEYTGINTRSIRDYLNQFIEDGILERLSEKIRDADAIYKFKKI